MGKFFSTFLIILCTCTCMAGGWNGELFVGKSSIQLHHIPTLEDGVGVRKFVQDKLNILHLKENALSYYISFVNVRATIKNSICGFGHCTSLRKCLNCIKVFCIDPKLGKLNPV